MLVWCDALSYVKYMMLRKLGYTLGLLSLVTLSPVEAGIGSRLRCALQSIQYGGAMFPDPVNPPRKYLDEDGSIVLAAPDFLLTPQNLNNALAAGYIPYFTHMVQTPPHPRFQFEHPATGRGVFHLPTTMQKIGRERAKVLAEAMEKYGYRVTFDTAFERVIRACSSIKREIKVRFDPTNAADPKFPSEQVQAHQPGCLTQGWYWQEDADGNRVERKTTWLTEEVIQAFLQSKALLAKQGRGHTLSVEVWDRNGDLVGGTFGTIMDSMYTGWSMFYDSTPVAGPQKVKGNYAGMVAMIAILHHLDNLGYTWVDTEEVKGGNLTANIGGEELTREEFMVRRAEETAKKIKFYVPQGDYSLRSLYGLPTPTADQLARMRDPETGTLELLKRLAYSNGKFFRAPKSEGSGYEKVWNARDILIHMVSGLKSLGLSPNDILSVKARVNNLAWQPDKNDGRMAFSDDEAAVRIVGALYLYAQGANLEPKLTDDFYDGTALFTRLGWPIIEKPVERTEDRPKTP
jgi:Leu/Phe-tRNA-protein transferase